MRLRNWKETIEPTIEETLMDVNPHVLDEPFQWYVEPGDQVWIRPADGKWRLGTVKREASCEYSSFGVERWFWVYYGRGEYRKCEKFKPLLGEMKPDSPEVRELVRKAGFFTP